VEERPPTTEGVKWTDFFPFPLPGEPGLEELLNELPRGRAMMLPVLPELLPLPLRLFFRTSRCLPFVGESGSSGLMKVAPAALRGFLGLALPGVAAVLQLPGVTSPCPPHRGVREDGSR